jgi:hypothetical protein
MDHAFGHPLFESIIPCSQQESYWWTWWISFSWRFRPGPSRWVRTSDVMQRGSLTVLISLWSRWDASVELLLLPFPCFMIQSSLNLKMLAWDRYFFSVKAMHF